MTARVQVAPRSCEGCAASFERRRFPSGQLERASQFAERRFCSRACYRKAAADGGRVRPVGEWEPQPYGLFGPVGDFPDTDGRLAIASRYPWDRQQGTGRPAVPGHFSATRREPTHEEPAIKETGPRQEESDHD